jgi:hypothetical protein
MTNIMELNSQGFSQCIKMNKIMHKIEFPLQIKFNNIQKLLTDSPNAIIKHANKKISGISKWSQQKFYLRKKPISKI